MQILCIFSFFRCQIPDGLDSLVHNAVVGGHHQDDQVGAACAPLAHRRERRVAGRVQEGDCLGDGRESNWIFKKI